MSTLKDIIHQNKNFKEFALGYGRHISQLLEKLDTDSLEKIVDGFNEARLKSKTIFVIGNGGSAASASHMANDLALGPRHHHEGTLRVVALTDNVPVLTATGNDLGYEQIFLRQLKVYYRPGDQLLVISASGNSSNLINSAQWVKAQGGTVWGFLGFDGGQLKALCDAAVVVKTAPGEYGPVEDVHMVLDHLLTAWFYARMA